MMGVTELRDLLRAKITAMNELETVHLYWNREDWKKLLIEKTLLMEILYNAK